MAVKIGHAVYDERSKASGGAAGDSTKKEVCISTWYNGKWDVVLRPISATVAKKSAEACEAACANDKIGYDQGERNSLYKYARAVNFDLSKITTPCETDCSELMHVCAIAGGANLSYGTNGLVTWNMVDAFMQIGQYQKLTASKYLTTDVYLKRGDILVRQSGHTAMVLEDGSPSKSAQTADKKVSVSLRLLTYGAVGEDVVALQILLNAYGFKCTADGEFGSKTLAAVKNFQKSKNLEVDGKVGTDTWSALLT